MDRKKRERKNKKIKNESLRPIYILHSHSIMHDFDLITRVSSFFFLVFLVPMDDVLLSNH
jgi:hypothetical protein